MSDEGRVTAASHRPKWRITLEWIRGNWVILIMHGKGPVHGCTTADDLQTAMSMAAELFEGCLEWPQWAVDKKEILLRPASPEADSRIGRIRSILACPTDPYKALGEIARIVKEEAASPSATTPTRETLAEWFFNNEADEAEADEGKQLAHRYARWPEDAAIQPYCRWAYRRADAFLARFANCLAEAQSSRSEASPDSVNLEAAHRTAQRIEALMPKKDSMQCSVCGKAIMDNEEYNSYFGAAAVRLYCHMPTCEASPSQPAPPDARKAYEQWVTGPRHDDVSEYEPMGWTVWEAAWNRARVAGGESQWVSGWEAGREAVAKFIDQRMIEAIGLRDSELAVSIRGLPAPPSAPQKEEK